VADDDDTERLANLSRSRGLPWHRPFATLAIFLSPALLCGRGGHMQVQLDHLVSVRGPNFQAAYPTAGNLRWRAARRPGGYERPSQRPECPEPTRGESRRPIDDWRPFSWRRYLQGRAFMCAARVVRWLLRITHGSATIGRHRFLTSLQKSLGAYASLRAWITASSHCAERPLETECSRRPRWGSASRSSRSRSKRF
jgi:hypothetical protein